MGYRLSRITTRTGDDGSTGLGDGSRVAKSSPRINALGDIDELNCIIGVLLSEALPDTARQILIDMQHDLFNLGGEICIPGHALINADHIIALENQLTNFNAKLPALKEFILPSGCRAAALAHQGRAVARRAERCVVALAEEETVRDEALQYLNRASDLLFVLARWLNHQAGQTDVLWSHSRP